MRADDEQSRMGGSETVGVRGEPVRAMPGTYTVRFVSQVGKPQQVILKPQETAKVALSAGR